MRSAYALVIGIDVYSRSDIPRLGGAVADAMAAVDWLVGIDVDPSNIFLHLGAATPPTPRTGVNALDARWDEIWKSMNTLSGKMADQLFIFISGHGFSIPGAGPIFLASDYGANNNTNHNFDLNAFMKLFQSWAFKDQFVFYDACQTVIATIGQISPVTPTGPPGGTGRLNIPASNALTACFAASAGEPASEDGYRGFMMSALLPSLNPSTLAALAPTSRLQASIKYDWSNGSRTVDLKRLFDDVTVPAVRKRAESIRRRQNAICRQFERAEREGFSPVLVLPPIPTKRLSLDINRREAAPFIEDLRLSLRAPERHTWLPEALGAAVQLPFAFAAPDDNNVVFDCRLHGDAPWMVVNAGYDQKVSSINTGNVLIEVRGNAPSHSDAVSQFNVKILDRSGGRPSQTIHGQYEEIAAEYDIPLRTLPEGVTFEEHEDGPNISFSTASSGNAAEVATQWRDALRAKMTPLGHIIVFSPPGETPARSAPTLRIVLSEDDAAAYAGFLTDVEIFEVKAEDQRQAPIKRSLTALLETPLLRVNPGRGRVSVTLPWDRFETTVEIKEGVIADLALPYPQGQPPLRNLWRKGHKTIEEIKLGKTPAGSAFHLDTFNDRRPLFIAANLEGITLLALRDGAELRLEPLSQTTLYAWDVLVTCGRLDGVNGKELAIILDDVGRLLRTDAELGVMLLAMAYAAFDQNELGLVRRILERLPGQTRTSPDATLLHSLSAHAEGGLEEPARSRLIRLLDEVTAKQRAPLLRWGIPLIQQTFTLLERSTPAWLSGFMSSSVWSVLRHSADTDGSAPEGSIEPV